MTPEQFELKEAIFRAVENAARALFSHRNEHFYYFSLITSGEAHAPIVSAWSHEALAFVPEDQRAFVKWSYADSPYFDFGAEYFEQVRKLFSQRPRISALRETARDDEYAFRFFAMEAALTELDARGAFGAGLEREQIVINVEVMPPDYTNTERAKRMNPAAALLSWLVEAAEE